MPLGGDPVVVWYIQLMVDVLEVEYLVRGKRVDMLERSQRLDIEGTAKANVPVVKGSRLGVGAAPGSQRRAYLGVLGPDLPPGHGYPKGSRLFPRGPSRD